MSSKKCPGCGLVNWAEIPTCKRCGFEFQPSHPGHTPFSYQPAASEPAAHSDHNFNPRPNYYSDANNQYSYAPRRQPEGNKTGLAIASLALGVIGFFTAGLIGIGAIIGLILGIVALKKIKNAPHVYGGKGMAIAGIVLNCLGFLSVIWIGIVAAIAIPNLLAARRAANEGAAISAIRTLSQAQYEFMTSSGNNRCGELKELASEGLIDSALSSGDKSGYKFRVVQNPQGCELHAVPRDKMTGTRSFYASSRNWEIHAANREGEPASATDPVLGNPTSARRSGY